VVRNTIGQEVRRLPVVAQRTALDVSDLPEGSYLVTIIGPVHTGTQRLVVVR
jgi:hypothetical protein